ncbi:AraC family transcriptional regulator [Vreelandella maris]|uniref:AraC family transcriptional regulator n=1 Tax=Vreelandella maris TaxID=2729617 RepID=A0A7Y6RC83_9GAMM|nr:AraC family transcriptional regulator [Halomonas maris]NVF14327.1 AraC family transcriptional regulator [Halomonas maris]|tara:strand:+ start:4440 stop:5408 length:969 start_codon:yes stop_codon:yes gene_type:complete
MDAALDVLRMIRFTGGIFLDAEFSAPWCVVAQVTPEDCRPFTPVPEGILAYHYVSAGQLLLQVGQDLPVAVSAGHIVLLSRNDPHLLGSELGGPPVSVDNLLQPMHEGGLARIIHGGGGETTRLLCGFLHSETPCNALIGVLPSVMTLNVAEGAARAWIESSFRFAAAELTAGTVRSPTLLARLAELLFIEAAQLYLTRLPPEQRTWVGGLRDPFVSRALTQLHGFPERHWTTQDLARQVGLSRSAFAEHFTELVGVPPMRYLARLRMQTAARRLRETLAPISLIALEAGYESEAAFSKAFKRALGTPPATWRRRHRAPEEP